MAASPAEGTAIAFASPFAGLPTVSHVRRQRQKAKRRARRKNQVAAQRTPLPRPVEGRPLWVRVVREHEAATITAPPNAVLLIVPDHASDLVWHVAQGVALMATDRLLRGYSLERALHRLAAGRDIVKRYMERLVDDSLAPLGCDYHRDTVFAGLQELVDLAVLDRIDQLGEWTDYDEAGHPQSKRGAFVYCVNVGVRQLLSWADVQARKHNPFRHARAWSPSLNAAHSGGRGQGRLEGCLRWAIEHAQTGQRNHLGHWLTRRCIDIGLDQATTIKTLDSYREGLRAKGILAGYTERETRATVRSAYRRARVGRAYGTTSSTIGRCERTPCHPPEAPRWPAGRAAR